jgi:aspartate aminotransferase
LFLNDVGPSPSWEIFNEVQKKIARGERVHSLAIGEPSFDTPPDIVNAAAESMRRGEVHYVSSFGTQEVREAISSKVGRKNGIKARVDNTLFITTKLAIFVALLAASDDRFDSLIPDPGYYYTEPALLAGSRPVRYSLASDFSLDVDEVRKSATPRTKVLILNTPSNPTGKVLGRSELRELLDFCADKGILIISDESYEDLVYEKEHVSIGSMESIPDRVVSVFSLSKSYAMTGWRAGYIVANERVVGRMNRFLENTLTCFPTFIQSASAYALTNGDRHIAKFRYELRKRRKLMASLIKEIDSLDYSETEGAFYAFPSYASRSSSRELSGMLLKECNVAVIPGSFFGPAGEGHIRLSFASSPETIEAGMRGIKSFFRKRREKMDGRQRRHS